MKHRVYSIRDKKLGLYQNLVFFDNDAVAIRAFGDLVTRDENSIIHAHPSDFSLCCIGEFDAEKGIVYCFDEGVTVVCDADSFGVKEA